MALTDKYIENKQVSIEDIIRLADMLEEYKKEWIQKADDEKAKNELIPSSNSEFESYRSETEYTIGFKDGRHLTEKGYSWLVQNLLNVDDVDKVSLNLNISYTDARGEKPRYRSMYYHINIYSDIRTDKLTEVDSRVDSDDFNEEADILHKQIDTLVKEHVAGDVFTLEEIYRYARTLESFKMDYDGKAKIEKDRIEAIPKVSKKYDMLESTIEYSIEWYDGVLKKESSYEWFIDNLKDAKNITRIHMHYRLSYYDKDNWNGITANVEFDLGKENYRSKAIYDVTSTNLEQEVDVLYNKIYKVFENCPIRLDKTIKNRGIRMQAFSIAVGIVLSYILFIVLKLCSGNFPQTFVDLLNNKMVIIFGQWVGAVVGGNVLASWFINMLYKPMLPEREYDHYDRSNGKSVYKDNIENFVKSSELQFGHFLDFKYRREKIEKMFKVSSIVVLVQLLISALLFLILK